MIFFILEAASYLIFTISGIDIIKGITNTNDDDVVLVIGTSGDCQRGLSW